MVFSLIKTFSFPCRVAQCDRVLTSLTALTLVVRHTEWIQVFRQRYNFKNLKNRHLQLVEN
jgi:hypothetical protein